jgi:hypothetical protein
MLCPTWERGWGEGKTRRAERSVVRHDLAGALLKSEFRSLNSES